MRLHGGRPGVGNVEISRRQLLAGTGGVGVLLALLNSPDRFAAQASEPLPAAARIGHLLRRAGFGATDEDLAEYRKLGFEGAVRRLIEYERVSNEPLARRLGDLDLDLSKAADMERWWAVRMVHTARPLQEKMVLFWHGHLTSALSKVGRPELMVRQNEFFRQYALADFPTILKSIAKDPAMMRWLDTDSSRKDHPNENYARELMELFSLGIGNYTEQDVREAARAFTGWTIDRRGEAVFDPRQHDHSEKTFLGQRGHFDGDDIVDIIVRQPASARFIARKLFAFFAYDDPEPHVLDPIVATYTQSGLSIKALVRAILMSDAFSSARAYRAKVKGPVELVIGAVRALGLETDGKLLTPAMTRMGQTPFNPPNVAGWHGGRAWLNTGTWLARLNFANALVTLRQPAARGGWDFDALVRSAGSPRALVDRVIALLLDGQVAPAQRQVLDDYTTPSGGTLPAGPNGERWLDERGRGILYLVMAMPEYHLN